MTTDERYFELLDKRRTASRAAAENERASIESGQIVGSANLLTSLQIVVGFLALMFFFLLIAIRSSGDLGQSIGSIP